MPSMKKYIVGALLSIGILVSPLFTQAASLTDTQVQAILTLLNAFGADQSTINNVQTALNGGTPIIEKRAFCHNFNNDITVGNKGDEIVALKTALHIANGTFEPLDIPSVFNEDTAATVVSFQAKYGIRQTGYVGPLTRAKLNKLYGCDTTQPPMPVPPQACPLTMAIPSCKVGYRLGGWCNQECFPDDNIGNFSASPTSGSAPLLVSFNTTASTDNGEVTIDFGDGQRSSFEKGLTHYYTSPGNYVAMLMQQPPFVCNAPEGAACAQMMPAQKIIGTVKINVTNSNQNSNAPVVNGIDGPASLNAGVTGTWTVRATVPNQPGMQLNYSVQWGDEAYVPMPTASSVARTSLQTSATFTHTYQNSGTYKPKFTVSNSSGSSSAEMNVTVGGQSISVSEQVKCVFNGATTEQKCWGDVPASTPNTPVERYGCSGVGTCVVTVKGQLGKPMGWGSSCGGSADTKIDGDNETAVFYCSNVQSSY